MQHEVKILTDEEFEQYQKDKQRQSFLKELENMSKPSRKTSSSFSVKNLTPKSEEKQSEPKHEKKSILSEARENLDISGLGDISENPEEWGEFMADLAQADMMSPIDSVTSSNMSGFQLDEDAFDNNRYRNVFKKEIAMISEVLKSLRAHGVQVQSALKKMSVGGKGSGSRAPAGVTKSYSDLVEAYTGINTTQLQAIKAMTDLKAKQVEWQLKEKASQPANSESVENVANAYYMKVMGGGTKDFVRNSLGGIQQADFEYDPMVDDGQSSDVLSAAPVGDASDIDAMVVRGGINLTQPIRGISNRGYDSINADEAGYIRHEKNPFDICVYAYGDGNYQFVALDSDGEVVEDVELPSDVDPDIVDTLQIRPGSDYVYDNHGRKYRVIEMGPIDQTDIDSMEYPYNDD